jgi:branched-chain amino acid transport system substrate-binding protein
VSPNASASLRLLFSPDACRRRARRADEAFRIYDARGVRAIFDITNSGVVLAVQDLAKARDRIVIFDSASSSDLTGKACTSTGVQWNADNWSNGVALMRLLIKEKLNSFFFITADYAFGASLEA